MRKREPETWEKWRGLVAAQERSGESVAAFCRERGISATHFFEWKKRLSQAAEQAFLAVRVAGEAEPAGPGPESGRAIEIRLTDGRSVLVGRGFEAGHLRAVLAVLEGRA
jgi:hypothetical protein